MKNTLITAATAIFVALFVALVISVAKPSVNNLNFGTINHYYFGSETQLSSNAASPPSPQLPREASPKVDRSRGKSYRSKNKSRR